MNDHYDIVISVRSDGRHVMTFSEGTPEGLREAICNAITSYYEHKEPAQ